MMMSNPLTLKAALVLKDGLASPVPVDPVKARCIHQMLFRNKIESEDACGPLRFKPIEKTLTALS
jgi:hypothetical protein